MCSVWRNGSHHDLATSKCTWRTFSTFVDIFLPDFRYMEEVIESTLYLLSSHHDHGSASAGTEKALEPIHLLALLDIKATWFKKWMVCIANEPAFFICAQ